MSSRADRGVLLVTAAGTGSGVALLERCRTSFPDVRRVAADIHPPELCAASAFCERFVRTRPVAEEGFAEELRGLLRAEAVTAYVPLLDEEVALASGLAAETAARTCAPAAEAAETCLDKLRSFAFLRREGIPTPETVLPAEVDRLPDGALFAKPRRGRGSIGARPLASRGEARALGDEFVVQQRLPGPEITVDAFASDSLFRALCRERIEVKAGVCTKARVFESEELAGIVARICGALHLRGASCVQLIGDGRGGFFVTDVNPRPGAGTALSAAAGVDFLSAHLAATLGRDPSPFLPPLGRERFVVRRHVELVTG
jgi:carbamoylphosphate synthase large subunit